MSQVLQPTRILNHFYKRVKSGKEERSHVNLLEKLSQLFTTIEKPGKPEKMFLMRKRNYEIIVNIGAIPSVMYKLLVMLNRGAGSIITRGDKWAPWLETQILHVTETAKICDTINETLRIISSIKLYVHGDRITELVIFFVCHQLGVTDILGCHMCDTYVAWVHPKTSLAELFNESTVPVGLHYGRWQSTNSTNSKFFHFSKHEGLVSHKIRST